MPLSAAGGEAFRLLRSSLKWTQGAESGKVFAVTSAVSQEGKTTTSANLAAAFALEGQRVLLIDCDLHRARLHHALRIPRNPGLAQVLCGHLPAASAIRNTFISGLWFLPAGRDKGAAVDLLGSDRMRSLLADLLGHFDVIILDTPPVLAVADATSVGPLTDGMLLVVRAGVTDRRLVGQALQMLESVGARVLGAVLNDSRGEVQRYGEYYYEEEYAAVVE
jgi:capsular exopolysaccharide synthesis family protein